jgi:4'-phosphopantetheinyl transferase
MAVNEPGPIGVLIVNDHPVVRQGLGLILSQEPDIALVGIAENSGEALQLLRRHRPDIILLDLCLSDGHGIDLILLLVQESSSPNVLVLTAEAAEESIFHALEAGARGYLTTDVDAQELLHAIRVVDGGARYLSQLVAQRLAARMAAPKLSPRQIDILQLIADGKENKEIAGQLDLHEGTIKAYIHRLFAKLRVTSRSQAVLVALHRGLIHGATLPRSKMRPPLERTPPALQPLAELASGQAHLWLASVNASADPDLVASYQRLLSPEETAELRAIASSRRRNLYLVSRASVRSVLSRYAVVDPRAWAFRRAIVGSPQVAAPTAAPPIRFSLSHTTGLVACLVALGRDVGVDVENIDRRRRSLELAEHCLGPSELTMLKRLPAAQQPLRFYEHWTIKESYLKARGIGLSLPLKDISVDLGGESPRLCLDPGIGDDPESWQVALFHPSPSHVVAATVRRNKGPDLTVCLKQVEPLGR